MAPVSRFCFVLCSVFESNNGVLEVELINVLINILIFALELFYLWNIHHFSISLNLICVLSTRIPRRFFFATYHSVDPFVVGCHVDTPSLLIHHICFNQGGKETVVKENY